jgi:hypothetical protein
VIKELATEDPPFSAHTPIFGIGSKYASSQVIRSNARQAILVAKERMEGKKVTPAMSKPVVTYGPGELEANYFPEALEERTREVFGGEGQGLCSAEMLRVPVVGSVLCRGRGEPRTPFSNPVLTAALIVGGAVLIYGVAVGFGGGMARRI